MKNTALLWLLIIYNSKKEHNISGHKWSTTQIAQISNKQNAHNTYIIMKTMCPPGYHHNGFVATHVLWNMMYGYTLLVPINQRVLNNPSTWVATQSHCETLEVTSFSWLHICYAHLASVRFEHSVCCGSLMTTYSGRNS